MKQIKNDLYLLVVATALAILFGAMSGSLFMARASDANAIAVDGQQAQSSTFQGTVQRNGERFFLRDAAGQIFQLDDSQHAQQFEGKSVRITGKLDSGAKLIHVERIEAA